MKKHELYGVKMVHSVDCMMPNFISTLPHETGENIYFLNSRAEAHRYAQICGTGMKAMTATYMHYGPHLSQKAIMPAVAIVYKVSCPEDVYKQLKPQTVTIKLDDKTAPAEAMYGPLTGMELHPIEAYVQEDPLHGACRYSLYEIGKEIASRWNDYREFNVALQNSTPAQLRLVDFSNLNIQGSLRLMYGESGRINTNFFTSHSNEDHMMSIERVMYNGHVGVGYMMNLLNLENQYQDTYHSLTAEGYSGEYAAAAAAKEMAGTLQMLSGLYNDQQADKETFTPLVNAYNPEMLNPAQEESDAHAFVEPTADEIDLFE